jgi:hypothetical protein
MRVIDPRRRRGGRVLGASRPRRPQKESMSIVVSALVATVLLGLLAAPGHPAPWAPSGLVRSAAPVPEVDECHSGGWQTTHFAVESNGCQASFFLSYAQNFNSWNASTQYNFSFLIPWIAELTPSGGLVRVASPLDPITDYTNVTSSATEVNISVAETVNVTDASGNWTPNDTWAGSGQQWEVGNATIGTTSVEIVFHLMNITAGLSANATKNASYSVKFDVDIGAWPWVSAGDVLGFGLASLAAGGAHFTLDQASGALSESWNSTNQTYASLDFGSDATATYPRGSPQNASVGTDTDLYFAASPDRRSFTLITFSGVAGNYSSISYDPLVIFSPAVVANGPPPAPGPALPHAEELLAAGLAAVAVIAGFTTLSLNRRRLRRQGEQLYEGMRQAISDHDDRPVDPK